MINAKHTPGPWGVLSTSVGPSCTAVCIGQLNEEKGLNGLSDEYAVCVVPLIHDESAKNVSLIEAAPDLLLVLEWAFETADTEQYEADWYAAARMAIARARGRD